MIAAPVNEAVRRIPSWTIYLASALWAAWLFYAAATGRLGVEPVDALEREYGSVALKLLVLGLAITPLRRWGGINLLRLRRAIGVSAFGFALAHLLVFVVLDVQSLSLLWQEVVKRPYVTVGMASFVMLVPLALTSNNLSLRRLGGAAWRNLHKLTYPAVILGAVHFLWLSRGWQFEPMAWLVIACALVAARVVPKMAPRRA